MKILHFADIHSTDKDLDEIEKCLTFILNQAREINPDLIAMAGDFFNSQEVKLDSKAVKLIFEVFSALANIAPVIGVIGTPSHDGKAAEVLEHIKAQYKIIISKKPELILYKQKHIIKHNHFEAHASDPDYNDVEAIISTLPTPTKQYLQMDGAILETDQLMAQRISEIFNAFGARASILNCPHIHIGHYQIGGAFVSDTQQLIGRDIEVSKDQVALMNADVVCLGHIHKPQKIGDNIFYSGSIYRKDWGELEEKGFYVHEIKTPTTLAPGLMIDFSEKLNSDFIKTPTRELIKYQDDLTDELMLENLNKRMNDLTNGIVDGENQHFKLTFNIYRDDVPKVNKKMILEKFKSAGCGNVKIELIMIPRENIRSANFIKLKTLADKMTEQAKLKAEEMPSGVLEKLEKLELTSSETIIKEVTAI